MTPRAGDVAAVVAAVAAGHVEAQAIVADDARGGAVVVVGGLVYATVSGCGSVLVVATLEELVAVAVAEDGRRDSERRGAA